MCVSVQTTLFANPICSLSLTIEMRFVRVHFGQPLALLRSVRINVRTYDLVDDVF